MQIRRALFLLAAFLAIIVSPQLHAQTAGLREVHVEGAKHLTEAQIASLTGLASGAQVGRKELQEAADALVRTGLFAKVNFKFDTHNDNLVLTFRIEENPRLRVAYDNFHCYFDSQVD